MIVFFNIIFLWQLQELDVEFDKVKDEKAVIQRYLRSQQAKQSKLAEAAEDDGMVVFVIENALITFSSG